MSSRAPDQFRRAIMFIAVNDMARAATRYSPLSAAAM